MFFVTYLRRELRRRMRQAVFIALGLALGVGLVVTVAAASAGVSKAESKVLSALYGVGTDVTVTGPVPKPRPGVPKGAGEIQEGRNGPEFCVAGGTCTSADGKTQNEMNSLDSGISAPKVAAAARLPGVAAAAGGIALSDSTVSYSKSGAGPQTGGYTLDGVDTGHLSLGPLSAASLTSGRSFTAADADADVAVADSGYATSRGLKVGSALVIDGITFTVIGIVRQPGGSNPPDLYVPLKAAQNLPLQAGEGSLKGEVNEIYLAAASAAGIPAVTREITRLLPGTEVTSASALASEVTGSVTSAAKLANDLGRWLSVLVLTAAFVVACLLTMAAVARRAAEFGTLKAVGWRTRRIIAQVLGESVATGIVGAAAGTGLGFAGAAIIAAVAPKLSATVGANTVPGDGGGGSLIGGSPVQTVAVPLHPSVTVGVILLAVILAVAGGLLAGSFGSWRIARLRPADALSRVG
jgi:putative ABC transport system permease protein